MADFFRMGDSIKDAILTIMKYIKAETGTEPTQEEVAELLRSYFILNEVANQIKYQLKKEATKCEDDHIRAAEPFWKMNLKTGSGANILVRAGVLNRCIKDAIDGIQQYMIKTMDTDPDYEVIAKSLKSSFILSEIKNQIDYQRKQTQENEDPDYDIKTEYEL